MEGERITSFPLSPSAQAEQAAAAGKASSPLWRLPLFLMLQYFVLCVHDSEFESSPSFRSRATLTFVSLHLSFALALSYQWSTLPLVPQHVRLRFLDFDICRLTEMAATMTSSD